MANLTHSFEWNGVTITVKAPDGFSRQKKWKLTRMAWQFDDEMLQEFGSEIAYHLANTVKVEGSLGFPVPNGDVTTESFKAFCEGIGSADEILLIRWDNALQEARNMRNDPDLLPPDELDEKKDETPTSSESVESND